MVSILMPSLNQARFLSAALASVLTQSFRDLELIVTDGGSTDGSLDILRAHAKKDGRLRWSSATDTGPAQAVNRAARAARGDVIGWLNADDLYAPDAIGNAVRFFREHPEAAMVYGHAKFIGAETDLLGDYPTREPTAPLAAFADGCFICQPTVFLTRRAWSDAGGLNESLKTSFDFDLWIRLFKKNRNGIGFLDRTQAFSRQHGATITSKHRRQVALEALAVLCQHLGLTPARWILTHIEEMMKEHPDGSGADLRDKVAALMAEARNLMNEIDFLELEQRVAADRRIALAGRHSFIDVHPDGWAGPSLTARLDTQVLRGLQLNGRSGLPAKARHRLAIHTTQSHCSSLQVQGQQRFEALLGPGGDGTSRILVFQVTSDKVFRPSESEPGSRDHRELSIMIEEAKELS